MIEDYCPESIEVSPPESVDSDGVFTWGSPVPMEARVQITNFTVSDGQGKGIDIEAVVYTDYASAPLDLGSRVVHTTGSYKIARRRVYSHPFDGPLYQSFLLERLGQIDG